MIINPNVGLATLGVAPVWASLSRLDGKGSYSFLVNPEEIAWTHQAEFSSLPVLNTGQPLTKYKTSGTALSIPKVWFWTPGNAGDLTATLASLKAMTKPPAPGLDPPLLKLTWGHLTEPRLYLRKLEVKEKQWRSGKVSSAEGSMDLLISPVAPKPQVVTTPPSTQAAKPSNVKLTDRERSDYQAKVEAKLRTDKNLAKKLGVNINDLQRLQVGLDGSVSVSQTDGKLRNIGTISTILGTIKPGHKGM